MSVRPGQHFVSATYFITLHCIIKQIFPWADKVYMTGVYIKLWNQVKSAVHFRFYDNCEKTFFYMRLILSAIPSCNKVHFSAFLAKANIAQIFAKKNFRHTPIISLWPTKIWSFQRFYFYSYIYFYNLILTSKNYWLLSDYNIPP